MTSRSRDVGSLTTRQLVAELHRLVAERARIIDELKQLAQRPT